MNYLTYPTKELLLSQTYLDNYSHNICATGIPSDYPIDETSGNNNRDYFYCPCDEMIIKRIYGVYNAGTNTIWMESTSPVVTPTFTDYVTIMVIHPNDDTLANLSVGQKFLRGDKMFLEGNDGDATGYHFHISVARGKLSGNGWTQNSKGCFVITSTEYAVKPQDAFYIDESFTTIIDTKGLDFKVLKKYITTPVYRDNSVNQIEVLVDNLRCRDNVGLNSKIIGYTKKGIYNYYEKITKDGYDWYLIGDNIWIAYNTNWAILYPKEDDNMDTTINNENNTVENVVIEEKESVFIYVMNLISKFVRFIKKILKKWRQ